MLYFSVTALYLISICAAETENRLSGITTVIVRNFMRVCLFYIRPRSSTASLLALTNYSVYKVSVVEIELLLSDA